MDFSSPPPSPSLSPPRKIKKEAHKKPIPIPRSRYSQDTQPLRRGTACLMCRAKKLKCSASKPKCDQCTKRYEKCVYDGVRPASRVEELAKKLAEMEDEERQAAVRLLQERRQSSGVPLHMPFSNREPVYTNSNYPGSTSDSYQSNTTTQAPSGSVSPLNTFQPLISHPMDLQWRGWTDINALNIKPEPYIFSGSTGMDNCYPAQPQMSWSLINSSTDVSYSDWNSSQYTSHPPLPGVPSSRPQTADPQNINTLPSLSYLSIPSGNGTSTAPIFPASFDQSSMNNGIPRWQNGQTQLTHEDVEKRSPSKELDENDIAQSARDYLTELFFSPPREAYGTEVFTESQFKARMEGPPDKRYHPCLLFAMYTEAASSSFIPAVRALSDTLYSIASKKIGESIKSEDRILDAIRASKMLGKWSNGRARVLEGYTWNWLSVSLAVACQLDKIPTSIFDASSGFDPTAWPILGPPKDQWELCERIHAFWSVWANEKGSSCMTGWPSALRDDQITTPLPRDPEAYLSGSIRHLRDIKLRDIYDLSSETTNHINYKYSWMFTALHLVHRAQNLKTQRPESEPTYRSFSNPPNGVNTTNQTIRERFPKQYQEMIDTLDHLERNLPREFGIDFMSEAPWSDQDVPMIHACLLTARMHLHPNITSDPFDLTSSLSAARTQIRLIKLWIVQIQADDIRDIQRGALNNAFNLTTGALGINNNTLNLNTGLSGGTIGTGGISGGGKRHKRAIAGPYMLMFWFKTVEVLRDVAGVYRSLGKGVEADECLREGQGVLVGLQGLGVNCPPS